MVLEHVEAARADSRPDEDDGDDSGLAGLAATGAKLVVVALLVVAAGLVATGSLPLIGSEDPARADARPDRPLAVNHTGVETDRAAGLDLEAVERGLYRELNAARRADGGGDLPYDDALAGAGDDLATVYLQEGGSANVSPVWIQRSIEQNGGDCRLAGASGVDFGPAGVDRYDDESPLVADLADYFLETAADGDDPARTAGRAVGVGVVVGDGGRVVAVVVTC
jgi:hypothetical protein